MGLENYIEIFTSDKDYLSGIGHTLMFTVISNIVKLIPALFLAIMLNEGIRGRGCTGRFCTCRPFCPM